MQMIFYFSILIGICFASYVNHDTNKDYKQKLGKINTLDPSSIHFILKILDVNNNVMTRHSVINDMTGKQFEKMSKDEILYLRDDMYSLLRDSNSDCIIYYKISDIFTFTFNDLKLLVIILFYCTALFVSTYLKY